MMAVGQVSKAGQGDSGSGLCVRVRARHDTRHQTGPNKKQGVRVYHFRDHQSIASGAYWQRLRGEDESHKTKGEFGGNDVPRVSEA